MEVSLTVVDPVSGRRLDLAVRADRGASTGDVLARLQTHVVAALGTGADRPLLLAGRALAPIPAWRFSGLRDGVVLTLGHPPSASSRPGARAGVEAAPGPAGALELRVVAGPAAGTVHPLAAGETLIGRVPEAQLQLDDLELSRRHASVTVSPTGVVTVRDLGSSNGTAVDGEPVVGVSPLPVGALLGVGRSLLALAVATGERAALIPGDDGTLHHNRPPRLRPSDEPVRIQLPTPPTRPDGARLPAAAVAVPLVLGGVLFLVAHQSSLSLLFMLMSPLMLVGNLVGDRRSGRRRYTRDKAAYDAAHASTLVEVEAARRLDECVRRAAAPDPAAVLATATAPTARLWERRRHDPDAYLLRIGVADLPAGIELVHPADDSGAPPPPTSRAVPVTLPLAELGVVGLAGPTPHVQALARWVVVQLAVLHSPRDLRLVVLTDEASASRWEFLRWLPHARTGVTDTPATDAGEPVDARVLIGTDAETCARRVGELLRIIELRMAAAGAQAPLDPRPFLVVLDGARGLRRVPGLPQVLAAGAAVGVYALCIDEEDRLLPEECRAVAVFQPGLATHLVVRRDGGADLVDVLADQVSPGWAEAVTRAIAPVRDAADDADAALPPAVRLLDLAGLEGITPAQVAERWRQGGRSTTALLGATADGPFAVDLRRDGPHALVAGTTGAGKSELLQTLIASLALANRPDALTFVLVDYKGGSAFKDCARLPHTVGLVTDLDGHLTERALASLTAELQRRERILRDAGVKDIEDLWATAWPVPGGASRPTAGPAFPGLAPTLRPPAPTLRPPAAALPRLVIVIDEFATLVEELPDFVRGLVGIAQRGRSLGVHLVLATQRPGGVVSADIRANTNLRICLRVTQPAESSDVIDARDAALVPRLLPGRGFARTGASELVAFQTARTGGHRPGPASVPAPVVSTVGWHDLGRPMTPPTVAAPDAAARTDLEQLVDAVRAAAETLGMPTAVSPWLPSLPEHLTLDELGPTTPGTLPLGLVDLPVAQTRAAYAVDLASGGHLLVAGAPRSGRSTVLRTLAGAVARACTVDDLHLYAVDCGNNALGPVTALPHCGACVTRDQPDRAARLLSRLTGEVRRRQELLAAAGFADLGEQRAAAPEEERLPYVLLLIDRWEGFLQSFEAVDAGRLVDAVHHLLREGPGVGLRVVLTTDRSGLVGRLPAAFEDRLVLRMADRADYALADVSPRQVPRCMPPGRALRVTGQGVVELQVALLTTDPAGPAQVAAFHADAAAAVGRDAARPAHHRPFRVDALPGRLSYADALETGAKPLPASPSWALVGVGGDELTPLGVDLSCDGPGFLVAGPPRSGRSCALSTMTRSLLDRGACVLLVAPRRGPLTLLAGEPGVVGVLDGASTGADFDAAAGVVDGPLVVVADDAERLTESALGPALEAFCRTAADHGHALLAAGTTDDLQATFRGFTLELRRSRCGLLLSPRSPLEGDLLGIRLPRGTGPGAQPGRGILALRGTGVAVQVPFPG